ncbi:hypothetical protein [Streptomyces sp. NBC_00154]|uniref:hypothetical protein n=1 Tax=Streptomyces sp. NBC_00154 TaxID=2975670 RepID=UPI0022577C1C|nr:hypothetical protein [Streptomyces sp. NBC_00154]MCX5317818.1 hypothetical protein [Streptomyces sp. NBC_00154]
MTFIAHVPAVDDAHALIADLAAASLHYLDGLGAHLAPFRLALDPEHKEVWWVAPEGEAWAVETTTPGQCLDLISKRADSTWASEPLARADYQRILDVLLPPTKLCSG